MQGELEQQLRLKQLRMIVVLMVVIFVAILGYTIFWIVDYNQKYGFFVKTEAEVVSQIKENGVTNDVVKFSVDNVEYQVIADYNSKNEVGDKIIIYYDKNNPIGIIESLNNNRIVLPVLTGIFGVLCIALIVVYMFIRKSYKKNIANSKKKIKI